MTPHAYCREKVARPGSTVYYSSLFLPERKREGVIAVSAFCREITNITRDVKEAEVARTKLAWWRSEIADTWRGRPHHPVALAVADVAAIMPLDPARFDEIIAGAEMDLDYNAYPDFDALKVYCRCVGGSVASLWAQICGYKDTSAVDAAGELGIAFQLTTIIRNVGEDARRNRIYVPLHELAQHGVTTDDVAHARETDNFRKLMAFQIERAERHYDEALAKLPSGDRKAQRPLLVATAIKRALLREIRSDGCRVLAARTSLTPMRKLWLAWRTPL